MSTNTTETNEVKKARQFISNLLSNTPERTSKKAKTITHHASPQKLPSLISLPKNVNGVIVVDADLAAKVDAARKVFPTIGKNDPLYIKALDFQEKEPVTAPNEGLMPPCLRCKRPHDFCKGVAECVLDSNAFTAAR
jgi:hypothetical protein